MLRHLISVGHSPRFPRSRARSSTPLRSTGAHRQRDFGPRSGDDLYIAYTGGTTGLPKGVLWRHEDIFFAAMGGGDPTTLQGPIAEPDEIVERVLPVGVVMLLAPPLTHVERAMGCVLDALRRRQGRAHRARQLRSRRGLAAGGHRVGERPHARRRRDGTARARRARGASRTLRRVVVARVRVGRRGAVGVDQDPGRARCSPSVITVDGFGSTETGVTGTRARHARRRRGTGIQVHRGRAHRRARRRAATGRAGLGRPSVTSRVGDTCRSATTRTRRSRPS